MIYQFTVHSNLPKGSPQPQHKMFDLYNKVRQKGVKSLTREEKNYITTNLYGIFGAQSSVYKLGGFAVPFFEVLPRILVKIRHYGWKEYYAPDKTSLRKAITGIIEMIEA